MARAHVLSTRAKENEFMRVFGNKTETAGL